MFHIVACIVNPDSELYPDIYLNIDPDNDLHNDLYSYLYCDSNGEFYNDPDSYLNSDPHSHVTDSDYSSDGNREQRVEERYNVTS